MHDTHATRLHTRVKHVLKARALVTRVRKRQQQPCGAKPSSWCNACMSCKRRPCAMAKSSHVRGRATRVVGACCSRPTSHNAPCPRRCTHTVFKTRDTRLAADALYGPRSTVAQPSTSHSVWSMTAVGLTRETQRCTIVCHSHGVVHARRRPRREKISACVCSACAYSHPHD